jgi:integrase
VALDSRLWIDYISPPEGVIHNTEGADMTSGAVYKKVWVYCTTHNQLVSKKGSAASCAKGAQGCKTLKRSKFEYCFLHDGKRVRASFPTFEEAQKAMRARQEELAKPAAAPDAPTLNEYADGWLQRVAASIQPRTLQSYAGTLKCHVRPTLGAMALNQITRAHVKDLLASKRATGLSKDSVRLIRATISAIFADGVDRGVVAVNPATRLGKAKQPDSITSTERREKVRAMTPTQLDSFLRVAAGDRLAALWLTLADCGLRMGEALALRWADVDLGAKKLHIHASVSRGGRVKKTKTEGARDVDMTDRLVAALRARGKVTELDRDAKLVFPSDAGTALSDINVGKVFRRLVKRAGLPHFRPYDLRHTYASHMLAAGEPLTFVSHQLGHARPTTTLAHYARWIPSEGGATGRLERYRAAGQ